MTNRSRGSSKASKNHKKLRRSSSFKTVADAVKKPAIPDAPTEISSANPRPRSVIDNEVTPPMLERNGVSRREPVDGPSDKIIESKIESKIEPQTEPMVPVVKPKQSFEDDRPTEIYDRHRATDLHTTRDQLINGPTIREIVNQPEHLLQDALITLVERARVDLPSAVIDARASLLLRHEFEFDRRVGYRLQLKLYGQGDRCVVVTAEVDHDGRAVRRGSMIAKLIHL